MSRKGKSRVRLRHREALYILLLAAAAGYYLYDTSYLSWLALLAAVLVPIFDWGISFFLLRKGRIIPEASAEVTLQSAGLSFSIQIAPPQVPAAIRGEMRAVNLFSGEKMKKKLAIPPGQSGELELGQFKGTLPGVVQCRVMKTRARDLLGLFPVPIPAAAPVKALILPEPAPFPGELARSGVMEDISRLSVPGAEGQREWKDIREYRSGDLLRDIHWKLSARRDQVIVREYAVAGGSAVPVRMRWAGTPEEISGKLGRLLGLLEGLRREDLPFALRVQLPDGEELAAGSLEETEAVLWDLLARPCPTAQTEGNFAEDSLPEQWLEAEKDAIVLYRDGVPEEVLS